MKNIREFEVFENSEKTDKFDSIINNYTNGNFSDFKSDMNKLKKHEYAILMNRMKNFYDPAHFAEKVVEFFQKSFAR